MGKPSYDRVRFFLSEHTPFIDVSKRTHKYPDMGQGHGLQDEEEVRIC
jgi:hypothetical protein